MDDFFGQQIAIVDAAGTCRVSGRVVEVTGMTVVVEGMPSEVGGLCVIEPRAGEPIHAQVVGARGDRAILMTLQEPFGIAVRNRVTTRSGLQNVSVGRKMLGAVLDGMGRPIGGNTDFPVESHYPVLRDAPQALTRTPIDHALATGIRSIDAMHTLGGGQRMGIFAGTGVGKSVLLGMIARSTAADVIVLALIGERGREVGDFLRKDLGEDALKRCVMVMSTSDESPVLRVRAGMVATAVAEYFRDIGKDVLLLLDSTTRIAMAQRQIGLSAGEPPTTKGYPPSVFSLLPKLLERSGRTKTGSITGLYTVLVEGDDINEPIADAIRGILDGHIWLSRDLANRGHYPAVSVLESISRVMVDVVDVEHRAAAMSIRRVLAAWSDVEDLVNVGAYAPGANIEFDVAVQMTPAIEAFLQQNANERSPMTETRAGLLKLASNIATLREKLAQSKPAMTGAAR
ncbi:MAG: FliI/YscN family ATPase [Planctomycetes bacterium]|nr:FliI/YscN family ATPase [Planctomycetota bacterium]MBI3835303.1 FliI/YscN family ATPase [Planctomycetota bacterium]